LSRAKLLILGAVILIAGAASCLRPSGEDPDQPTGKGHELLLLYADNVKGILVSCGCPGGQMGGLAKRRTGVAAYRRPPGNTVLVDSGGYLAGRIAEEKIPYVMRALAEGRYDAVALGEGALERLARGQLDVSELSLGGAVPLVSSNVRLKGVPAWRIVEKGALKVGIFQVFTDKANLWRRHRWPKSFEIKSAHETARACVRKLRQRQACDLVIALTRQTVGLDRELAKAVPGIDIIVGGYDGQLLRKPIKEGDTLIVQAGAGGHYLGALRIRLEGGRIVDAANEFLALTAQVPAHQDVKQLYAEYLEAAGSERTVPQDDLSTKEFKGAERCRSCHGRQYRNWRTSGHARALKTVERVERDRDPECKFCHTMGFRRKGGFRSRAETPGLANVTCQGCHLPGQTAIEGRELECRDTAGFKASQQTCRTCHTSVTSPAFDFQRYYAKVRHDASSTSDTSE